MNPDDVNEAVASEWIEGATPRERVREVISTEYKPMSAEDIADTARTSTKIARQHMDVLAESGYVTVENAGNGEPTFRRSSESLIVEQAMDIFDAVSTDELVVRVSDMRERVSDFQTEYDVESPETVAGYEDIDSETIREWQTTRRNLAFANVALSIANAEQYVGDES